MHKKLAIIGCGELGIQIQNIAKSDDHFEDVIFFDDFVKSNTENKYNIVGKTNEILSSYKKDVFSHLIIGIGYDHMQERANFFNMFCKKIPFANLLHSSCIIGSNVDLGQGNVFYPGVIIDANVKIENNVLINLGCTVSHDSIIESHCYISPAVSIAGYSKIGQKSMLGINCTIINNLTLCSDVIIGAGSVIIDKIKEPGVYAGNPGKLIKKNIKQRAK